MPSSPPPRSRGPRHAACERCRRRKQRCDIARPSCGSCIKSGQSCEYPAEASDPTDYVRALEERVRLLESRMTRSRSPPSHHPPAEEDIPSRRDYGTLSHENRPDPPRSFLHSLGDAPSDPTEIEDTVVGFTLGLHAEDDPAIEAPPTAHIPPRNDQLLDRLPIASLLPPAESAPEEPLTSSSQPSRNSISPEVKGLLAWGQRTNLFEQFLRYYNSAYRVFDEESLRNTFHSFPLADAFNRYEAFLVYMVLCIALASLNRGLNPDPRRRAEELILWQHARTHLGLAFQTRGLLRAQARHLVLHYSLMRPEMGSEPITGIPLTFRRLVHLRRYRSMRDRLGFALRATSKNCFVDVSRRGNASKDFLGVSRMLKESLKLRTFCVDINLSTALGRPPAIAWDWVSAQMPALTVEEPYSLTFRHMIDLRLLQAEINRTLYTETAVGKPVDMVWLEAMQGRIDQWHQDSLPPLHEVSLMNEDWHTVSYHISVALLNRPCPANIKPMPICLQRARLASRSIMQLFKSMHRKGRISLGWLAINHLFMSGVTFLNCLLLEPDKSQLPPLASVVMDIQACASTLEGLTSLHISGHDLRDAFEQVSMSVITALSGSLDPPSLLSLAPSTDVITNNGPMQEAWESLQSLLMGPTGIEDVTLATDNGSWSFDEVFGET